MMELDFSVVVPYLPQLFLAAAVTLKIGVLAFGLALFIAILVGTLRSVKLLKIISLLLTFYVEIFRGTPLLIQLFILYYGLPSFGITLSPLAAGVLGLGLNTGAYMSEIVRASIMAVDIGQYEAAYALGYSKISTFMHIVLPQAFRVALPPFMNSFSALLKETSLVSVISISELTRLGNHIYARTFKPFEIYITLAVFYFAMTYAVTLLSKYIERRSDVWVRS